MRTTGLLFIALLLGFSSSNAQSSQWLAITQNGRLIKTIKPTKFIRANIIELNQMQLIQGQLVSIIQDTLTVKTRWKSIRKIAVADIISINSSLPFFRHRSSEEMVPLIMGGVMGSVAGIMRQNTSEKVGTRLLAGIATGVAVAGTFALINQFAFPTRLRKYRQGEYNIEAIAPSDAPTK